MEKIKIPIPEIKVKIEFKGTKQSELYTIEGSESAADLFRLIMNDGTILFQETAILLCLSRANKVLGYYKLAAGGLTGCVVDPRVIFTIALNTAGTASILIAHNHPSGSTKPSRADEEITHRIKESGNMLEIKLLDHIIITDESYFSFADNGIL